MLFYSLKLNYFNHKNGVFFQKKMASQQDASPPTGYNMG